MKRFLLFLMIVTYTMIGFSQETYYTNKVYEKGGYQPEDYSAAFEFSDEYRSMRFVDFKEREIHTFQRDQAVENLIYKDMNAKGEYVPLIAYSIYGAYSRNYDVIAVAYLGIDENDGLFIDTIVIINRKARIYYVQDDY